MFQNFQEISRFLLSKTLEEILIEDDYRKIITYFGNKFWKFLLSVILVLIYKINKVEFVTDPQLYFANRLHSSIKLLGTDNGYD